MTARGNFQADQTLTLIKICHEIIDQFKEITTK